MSSRYPSVANILRYCAALDGVLVSRTPLLMEVMIPRTPVTRDKANAYVDVSLLVNEFTYSVDAMVGRNTLSVMFNCQENIGSKHIQVRVHVTSWDIRHGHWDDHAKVRIPNWTDAQRTKDYVIERGVNIKFYGAHLL